MQVFIYDNKEKDFDGALYNKLSAILEKSKVEYKRLSDDELNENAYADAIFVIGGDGTILWLTEFAVKNNIPIIGINMGKLGFLTEFEVSEMQLAVDLLVSGELKIDSRSIISVTVNGCEYFALNDAYICRFYDREIGSLTAEIIVSINGKPVEEIKGDGVIISTPTGSTAYSLSVGGPVISPDSDVLAVTPIAAHDISQRALVFPAKSNCELMMKGKAGCGLFVDGKFVCELIKDNLVSIIVSENKMQFLRKKSFDFYNRLNFKLKRKTDL
jgi:NAD+ kinase